MEKDFDTWNTNKKDIHKNRLQAFVHKREIWWCSLGLNIGDEEDGKNELFERPVLVLKVFNQNIVLVVPLTTKAKDNKYHFNFLHDGVVFAAILSQIRLLSTNRFTRKIRKIEPGVFFEIKEAIKRELL